MIVYNFDNMSDLVNSVDAPLFTLLQSLLRTIAGNQLFRRLDYDLGDGRSIRLLRNEYDPFDFTLKIFGAIESKYHK